MRTFAFIIARTALFGICLMFCAIATAQPVAITTESFEGDDFSFTWVFSFTLPGVFELTPFEPDPNKHPSGRTAGINLANDWQPRGILVQTDGTARLMLTSTHLRDPHTDMPGGGETFDFDGEIQSLAERGEFKRLIEDIKNHKDSVGDHKDGYKLSYIRSDDKFNFKLEGMHVVPVPAAWLLLGSGLAAFGAFTKVTRKYPKRA